MDMLVCMQPDTYTTHQAAEYASYELAFMAAMCNLKA